MNTEISYSIIEIWLDNQKKWELVIILFPDLLVNIYQE